MLLVWFFNIYLLCLEAPFWTPTLSKIVHHIRMCFFRGLHVRGASSKTAWWRTLPVNFFVSKAGKIILLAGLNVGQKKGRKKEPIDKTYLRFFIILFSPPRVSALVDAPWMRQDHRKCIKLLLNDSMILVAGSSRLHSSVKRGDDRHNDDKSVILVYVCVHYFTRTEKN